MAGDTSGRGLKFSPGFSETAPRADDFYDFCGTRGGIMMLNCLFVGLGGFIGSVCRYLIGLLPVREGTVFPWKTLAINVAGAFVIGLIAALAARKDGMDPRMVLFWRVGLCGGFTTFSTFAFESGELLRQGSGALALAYILSSVCFSILAVFAAQTLIR